MKHRNIPVFIPHLGCPHDCVFCNQRSISGKIDFDINHVDSEIDTALCGTHSDEYETEIAFFGGSFTGIDRTLMIALLEKAYGYIKCGKANSIRISTRPDYIDGEILSILHQYGVTDIELGIQSTDDRVLALCERGHTAEQSLRACEMIVNGGFRLVGQMMIALPGSSSETERKTARDIARMGAVGARVYPTVVFHQTALAELAATGEYQPLPPEQTVARCADVLDIFDRESIKVLRVGLCAQENLCDGSAVAAGSYEPAIGERAQSELFYRRITERLVSIEQGTALTVSCAPGAVSKVIGHKKANYNRFREFYGIKELKIIEKKSLVGYNILINEQ